MAWHPRAIPTGPLPAAPRPVFFGWNDAAWGRPKLIVGAEVATAYGRGYQGGVVFREREGDRVRARARSHQSSGF